MSLRPAMYVLAIAVFFIAYKAQTEGMVNNDPAAMAARLGERYPVVAAALDAIGFVPPSRVEPRPGEGSSLDALKARQRAAAAGEPLVPRSLEGWDNNPRAIKIPLDPAPPIPQDPGGTLEIRPHDPTPAIAKPAGRSRGAHFIEVPQD